MPSKISIVPFSEAHGAQARKIIYKRIDAVYKKESKAKREYFKQLYTAEHFEKLPSKVNALSFVALDGDKVVGLVFGWCCVGHGYIHWLWSDEAYKIDVQLLDHMLKSMKKAKAYKVEAFCSTEDRKRVAMYKKAGFVPPKNQEPEHFVGKQVYLTKDLRKPSRNELSVKVHAVGMGGMGIKLLGTVLAKIFATLGRHVSVNFHYDSVVRGGYIASEVIYSEVPVVSPVVDVADVVLDVSKNFESQSLASKEVLYDRGLAAKRKKGTNYYPLPLKDLSEQEFGSYTQINMISLGVVLRHLGVPIEAIDFEKYLPAHFVEKNLRAIQVGYAAE